MKRQSKLYSCVLPRSSTVLALWQPSWCTNANSLGDMYQSIDLAPAEVEEKTPGCDCVLQVYGVFSATTAAFIALITVASLVLTIRDTEFSSSIAVVHLILRIYSLFFMCAAFLCEMEWLEVVRQSAVFQNWVFRGLFYSYLGLFSFVEYANFEIDKSDYSWIVEAFSLGVFVAGLLYTLLGAFDCKRVKNERTIRYIQILTQSEVEKLEGGGSSMR